MLPKLFWQHGQGRGVLAEQRVGWIDLILPQSMCGMCIAHNGGAAPPLTHMPVTQSLVRLLCIAPSRRAVERSVQVVEVLAHTASTLVHHLDGLTEVADSMRTLLQGLLGHAQRGEQAAALAARQRSVARAMRTGMLVLLGGTAVAALRFGAIWEVHAACAAPSARRVRGWGSWLLPAGGQPLLRAGSYVACAASHMGEWRGGACSPPQGTCLCGMLRVWRLTRHLLTQASLSPPLCSAHCPAPHFPHRPVCGSAAAAARSRQAAAGAAASQRWGGQLATGPGAAAGAFPRGGGRAHCALPGCGMAAVAGAVGVVVRAAAAGHAWPQADLRSGCRAAAGGGSGAARCGGGGALPPGGAAGAGGGGALRALAGALALLAPHAAAAVMRVGYGLARLSTHRYGPFACEALRQSMLQACRHCSSCITTALRHISLVLLLGPQSAVIYVGCSWSSGEWVI